jgi:3'(2'), 5'-bisphosphate nucleotidase
MTQKFYQTDSFLQKMIKLIRQCNKIVLDVYNDSNSDFTVITKDDNSPLTRADTQCNDCICDFLKDFNTTIPNIEESDIGIISEEIKNETYDNRKNLEWTWLVDPLDGTKEFIKKTGEFTVNIGLCHFGVPVFGAVSIPVTGEIYCGIKDRGSYKMNKNTSLVKLEIPSKNLETLKTQQGSRIVASVSHLNTETQTYIDQFNEPSIVNAGSSIKLLWIAENKADVYPRIAPTSEWDTCAAHAVVKYAGGHVVKYSGMNDVNDSESELEYNKENILNPYFVVY